MPIPLPNLDDRTYADLTAEARALIPILLPDWTDHNPSDPGIVLVELLAWLTEMLMFQVNEVPPASTDKFLRLLNGPGWSRPGDMTLDEATRRTIRDLRDRFRAVTAADHEHLALHDWPATAAAGAMGDEGRLARVRCVPRRNLAATDPEVRGEPAPGHVSLVVMPVAGPGVTHPEPTGRLLEVLADFLEPRRMLASRLHVVGPSYVEVAMTANLAVHEDADPQAALTAARQALEAFFDPLTGGPGGSGWPFGRDVYTSEVYAVLDQVPLLDYIEDVAVTGPRPRRGPGGEVTGIGLDAHQLVRTTAIDLVAYDVLGDAHTPAPPAEGPVVDPFRPTLGA
jgi:hypothetical protein